MWKTVFNPLEGTMERTGVLRDVVVPGVCGRSVWLAVAVVLVSSCLQVCSACESWEFRCLNGDCVKGSFRCDAVPHCPDASDELRCPALTPTANWTPIPCGSGQFQCHNGRCIYPGWRCDGQDDCQDMSDERSCPNVEAGSPMMSMGSIIGLSIAVAGLFIVVIGIAIMLTCIRRKNMMNAREVALQSRLFQHDCYPFSISGMMLDREPPPRYNSQPDLSILPPGMLQEHLANLAMQPPPYYTSQPDLSPAAAYCPHVLEAPPRYTSHVNLSNSVPPEDHVTSPNQSEPDSRRPSGPFTNSEVLHTTFEEDFGSLDSRRGRRGWSKNSSISSKGSYKDRALKSGGGNKRTEDRGMDKGKDVKKVEVNIRDDGMEEYQGSVQLDCTRQVPCVVEESALRRNRTARHCASTPALLHHPYTSETEIADDLSGYHQSQRTTIAEPINENYRLNRAVNDSSRRYRQHCSYSMMDIPDEGSEDNFSVDTRVRVIDPEHTSNSTIEPSQCRDTDMRVGGPVPPPQTNYPPSNTREERRDRTSPPLPVSSGTAGLQVHRPPSQTVLNLNHNRLQAQGRLSKSMSTLTTSNSVQRNDSFNSVTSWDC